MCDIQKAADQGPRAHVLSRTLLVSFAPSLHHCFGSARPFWHSALAQFRRVPLVHHHLLLLLNSAHLDHADAGWTNIGAASPQVLLLQHQQPAVEKRGGDG